jgi:hypothetical protein
MGFSSLYPSLNGGGTALDPPTQISELSKLTLAARRISA